MAGSYYVEKLTREIYDRAYDYIRKIDEMGGAPTAIEQGYVQREIQDSAYTYQREIEKEERIVVGLNRFHIDEEKPKNLLRVDPSVRTQQIARLEKLKAERNNDQVKSRLAALDRGARGDENLMPLILDAVREYATLGEICDVLRGIFGEYQAINTLG